MAIISISDFFKNTDVKVGDVVKFITAPDTIEVDFSQAKDNSALKKVTQGTVELMDGRKKIITLNKTSLKALIAKWGNNSDAWVGEKCEITFVKQLAFGRLMDVLVLVPLE